MKLGTAIQIFADLMGKGLQSKGRDPDVTLLYKDWLYEAGCKFQKLNVPSIGVH